MTTCLKFSGPNFKFRRKYLKRSVFSKSWKYILGQSKKNTDLSNLKNVIMSCLNVNAIRNKLENLREIIKQNIDVLAVAETKIDASFLSAQFFLEGHHSPYRLDISRQYHLVNFLYLSSISEYKPLFLNWSWVQKNG